MKTCKGKTHNLGPAVGGISLMALCIYSLPWGTEKHTVV